MPWVTRAMARAVDVVEEDRNVNLVQVGVRMVQIMICIGLSNLL